MEHDPISELQRIEGITEEIAHNLVGERIVSCDQVLVAGEQGLKRIAGIDAKDIKKILVRAAALTDEMQRYKQTKSALVEEKVLEFRADFQEFIRRTKARYADKMDKDKVQAFVRESKRLDSALEAIEKHLTGYLAEVHKSLDEAEEKISELSDSKIRKTTKTLKKARKQLSRVID